MEVGPYKIGVIVQARLGSTRLPNKVLKKIPVGGKETVLSRIVNSVKEISTISNVVVATSELKQNDILDDYCKKIDVECFRGDENNVLSRFYFITKLYNFDYIIRLTGDNPIIDSKLLNEFINNHILKQLDYSNSQFLPLGCNFEMIKASEIIVAHEKANEKYDLEHVTPFIKRNAKKQETYSFSRYKSSRNLRFTIDYPSDYAFLNIIFSEINSDNINLDSIIKYVKENSWLTRINENNFQNTQTNSLIYEIKLLLPLLEESEISLLKTWVLNKKNKNL